MFFLPLLAVLLLLLWAVRAGTDSLRGFAAVYGENQCREKVTEMLLSAAEQAQAEPSELLSYREEGYFTLDSGKVNAIQTGLGLRLSEQLRDFCAEKQQVALGTLTGNALLFDRGPKITMRFLPVGSASVQIESELRESGINQVLYQVQLQLSAAVTVLLPGERREVRCSQQVMLEEILLSGDTPLAYGAER